MQKVNIPGGQFLMGSDRHYPEERPAHRVQVSDFAMDATPVTCAAFTEFVEATGYVTVAEQILEPADFPGVDPEMLIPGSLVFRPTGGPVDLSDLNLWWHWVQGATWRCPEGPGSECRPDHPVVHVTYEDAAMYAAWADGRLPAEAEWEYAARGGLDGSNFAWGDAAQPDGAAMANVWEGEFPWRRENGEAGTTPVAQFPPNGFGLFDVTGNVWEWTLDWWRGRHPDAGACCAPVDPVGPEQPAYDPAQPDVPLRVLKGGSHLCADSYCHRYRPAARIPQAVQSSTSHIGFRCVYDLDVPLL